MSGSGNLTSIYKDLQYLPGRVGREGKRRVRGRRRQWKGERERERKERRVRTLVKTSLQAGQCIFCYVSGSLVSYLLLFFCLL